MDLKLLDSNIKNLVRTSLTGLTSINQEVAIFDFGNVIVQKKYFENSNVRIISGGAYCFGDMVGKGMLTAAAQGWKKGMYAPISLESSILTGKLRRKDRLSPPIRGPILREALANIILFTTQFACEALISCERQLNIIDSERGDGDTGTRLRNVSEIVLKRLKQDKLVINCPFAFFETLSKLLESTIGGILGCIYSIMFEAAAKIFGDFSETTEITPFIWLKSFEAAGDALKRYGNIEYGDGTMYDPICAFIKSSRLELEQGKNFIDSFGKGVKAAEETVQLTKRKKYKYPDPGAHGVGVWMRAVYEGVKFRCPLD